MATTVKSEFASGLLYQGQRGEVVVRLLLWQVYTRAVLKDYPNDSQPHFSKGCKLISIFTYGCPDRVYSVISPSDKSRYKFHSGHCDILDEHPRKDNESLRAVADEGYHWMRSSFFESTTIGLIMMVRWAASRRHDQR